MFHSLFEAIYGILHSATWLAPLAAFAWGILSILLSPCNLMTIPLVVGYIENDENPTTKRAFFASLAFSSGIFVNLAVVGMVLTSSGILMTDVGKVTNYLVAVVFIAIGLHLAGVIRIPWFFGRGLSVGAAGGMKGALLLGLFSGLALGPCSFAYVAPLLALTMKTAASNLPLALALVLLYALGHCSVILAAGTFTSVVSRYLRWGESDHLNVVNRILGGVIILIGLYFIYSAPR